MKRNRAEMIFLWLFVPLVVLVYVIKSYPKIITGPLGISDPFGDFFFLFGKSPNFWYPKPLYRDHRKYFSGATVTG